MCDKSDNYKRDNPVTVSDDTYRIQRCTTTLCDSLLVTCDSSVVFSNNKNDCHDITETMLKVELNTKNLISFGFTQQKITSLIKTLCYFVSVLSFWCVESQALVSVKKYIPYT